MKRETLSPWEMLALTTALRKAIEAGIFNPSHKHAEDLLTKLETSSKVTISYGDSR